MKRLFLLFFSVVFGLGLFFSAIQSLQAKEKKSEEFQLEEITVTAEKREENVQKVPIAMQVLSASDLKVLGKNDLDQILSDVPDALINKSADGLRISLRGVSDDASPFHGQSVSMPTVAVNLDGIYSNRKDTGSGLFDLDRVEVLYGPQSTLYSTNSPGGIVNVETAKPKLNTFEASGTVEYGNYNLLHTEGMVNAPINDIIALRAAFQTQVRDGYVSNGGDDEDSKSGRLRALVQPTEKFSFLLTGEISKSTNHGFSSVDTFADQDDKSDPWHSSQILPNPSSTTSKQVYGRVDWDLSFMTMSLVPSYTTRAGDSEERMAFGTDVTINRAKSKAEEKNAELRLSSSPDFFFKWIVGFNYYKAEDVRNSLSYDESGNPKISTTTSGDTLQEFRDVTSEETAKVIFLNATYPITNRFRATGGWRYSWDDLVLDNRETRGVMGGAPGRIEAVHEPFEQDYSKPDFKVGVEFDLTANSMVYADYSTSYRVQAMGGGGPGTQATDRPPEKLKAYTAGAKNRFFDNKLQVNASAFYYDYENFSAGDMVIGYYGGLTPDTFDSNATQPDPNSSDYGDGRWYGADISTTAIITPKDVLNLSVSYLNSEWTDLTFDYYYQYQVVGAPPGAPITLANIAPLTPVTYNGKPMTSSPKWTVNATYTHNFSLWNGSSLDTRVEVRYKSDYKLSWKDRDYPNNYQEPFAIYNLSASYNTPDGKWSLTGYVKNLTNYAEKRMFFGDPINELTIGNPRTYGAVLSAHF